MACWRRSPSITEQTKGSLLIELRRASHQVAGAAVYFTHVWTGKHELCDWLKFWWSFKGLTKVTLTRNLFRWNAIDLQETAHLALCLPPPAKKLLGVLLPADAFLDLPQVWKLWKQFRDTNNFPEEKKKKSKILLIFWKFFFPDLVFLRLPIELLPEGGGAAAGEQPGHQPDNTLHMVRLCGKRAPVNSLFNVQGRTFDFRSGGGGHNWGRGWWCYIAGWYKNYSNS